MTISEEKSQQERRIEGLHAQTALDKALERTRTATGVLAVEIICEVSGNAIHRNGGLGCDPDSSMDDAVTYGRITRRDYFAQVAGKALRGLCQTAGDVSVRVFWSAEHPPSLFSLRGETVLPLSPLYLSRNRKGVLVACNADGQPISGYPAISYSGDNWPSHMCVEEDKETRHLRLVRGNRVLTEFSVGQGSLTEVVFTEGETPHVKYLGPIPAIEEPASQSPRRKA